MTILTLLSTSAASATGSTFAVRGNTGLTDEDTGVLQVDIGTSGTVTLQGRLSSEFSWSDIHSVTSSSAAEVPLLPKMRATLSGGSGAILVGLYVPRGA